MLLFLDIAIHKKAIGDLSKVRLPSGLIYQSASSAEFLGIVVEQNLNWRPQINKDKNKLYKALLIIQIWAE